MGRNLTTSQLLRLAVQRYGEILGIEDLYERVKKFQWGVSSAKDMPIDLQEKQLAMYRAGIESIESGHTSKYEALKFIFEEQTGKNRAMVKAKPRKKAEVVPITIDAKKFPALLAKLKEFAEYRKSIRKPIKDSSKNAFIRRLERLSGGDEATAVEILENSMANGYQGIFPIKGTQANNSKSFV